VEQQIMKVPKDEVAVAFGWPQPTIAGSINLEKDSAMRQQSEKRDPGKTIPMPQVFDFCGSTSIAMMVATFGSQILNNAPEHGDSRIISLPRRRM
jgi:hypothetical protein